MVRKYFFKKSASWHFFCGQSWNFRATETFFVKSVLTFVLLGTQPFKFLFENLKQKTKIAMNKGWYVPDRNTLHFYTCMVRIVDFILKSTSSISCILWFSSSVSSDVVSWISWFPSNL